MVMLGDFARQQNTVAADVRSLAYRTDWTAITQMLHFPGNIRRFAERQAKAQLMLTITACCSAEFLAVYGQVLQLNELDVSDIYRDCDCNVVVCNLCTSKC